MNEKTLWIMSGCPGSGKSTWLRQNAFENSVVISRDAIRFAMLDGEDEAEYFKYEDKVWNKFINDIRTALTQNDNVYVDATHINETSRNKVLDTLHLSDEVKVIPVFIKEKLETCLHRNSLREGRANVPEKAIIRMYNSLHAPNFNEKHYYANIITVYKGAQVKTWNSNETSHWEYPPLKDYSSNIYSEKSYKINLKNLENL